MPVRRVGSGIKWKRGQPGPEAQGLVGWAGGSREPQKCLSRIVTWSDSYSEPSGCCVESGRRLQVAPGEWADELMAVVVIQVRGEWWVHHHKAGQCHPSVYGSPDGSQELPGGHEVLRLVPRPPTLLSSVLDGLS